MSEVERLNYPEGPDSLLGSEMLHVETHQSPDPSQVTADQLRQESRPGTTDGNTG